MIALRKICTLSALICLLCISVAGQEPGPSERKKIRYLKKIERKNERYVKKQEKKTKQVLSRLSEKESSLYEEMDSTKWDSSLVKNSFSILEQRFSKASDKGPEVLFTELSNPVFKPKAIDVNSISDNLSGDLRDYLHQQLTVSSFLSDSACASCTRLKSESEKARQNISRTAAKLERLKQVQADIKKHQEALKRYGVQTPELADKIKGIDKSCYYYTQGMKGFKDLYTNPAKGIESSLLRKLSFSKDFKLFQNQFNLLPSSLSSLATGGMPDMSGYQTKAQVQAMLPQHAAGITPDVKNQLLSNLQTSLMKFTELRDEKPDLSLLSNKPDFKVNPYKGLPLRKRLVPGFTFQPQLKKTNEPFLTDLGATLGFKLTQRLTPLIGAAANVGLGRDIHHLQFSYQGVAIKAGLDTKLCYGFSFQSWYEANWRHLPDQLLSEQASHDPQFSLIAGICHTYRISKKVSGTLMMGYEFFYNKHTPYSSPWVIRMGWQ